MTMDGAARPWMEQVREADWSPDGSTLAIVHDLGTKDQLEYPVGKILHQSAGYLSEPRVSPDGSRVAFFEHPARFDDRGWLKVTDRNGTVTARAGEFWGVEGLAWSPDGRSLLFSTAGPTGGGYYPQIVSADGQTEPRPAFPSITSAEVMDIAPDGRMLVNSTESRLSIRALLPGESTEREFPWLELPLAKDISADGKWLLFSDEAQSAGLNYAVALRKTDGTPAVRLGEGARWRCLRMPSGRSGLCRARRQNTSCCIRRGQARRCRSTSLQLATSMPFRGSPTARSSSAAPRPTMRRGAIERPSPAVRPCPSHRMASLTAAPLPTDGRCSSRCRPDSGSFWISRADRHARCPVIIRTTTLSAGAAIAGRSSFDPQRRCRHRSTASISSPGRAHMCVT